jgi:hypothetical protein
MGMGPFYLRVPYFIFIENRKLSYNPGSSAANNTNYTSRPPSLLKPILSWYNSTPTDTCVQPSAQLILYSVCKLGSSVLLVSKATNKWGLPKYPEAFDRSCWGFVWSLATRHENAILREAELRSVFPEALWTTPPLRIHIGRKCDWLCLHRAY